MLCSTVNVSDNSLEECFSNFPFKNNWFCVELKDVVLSNKKLSLQCDIAFVTSCYPDLKYTARWALHLQEEITTGIE